jgi:hypothetical protein
LLDERRWLPGCRAAGCCRRVRRHRLRGSRGVRSQGPPRAPRSERSGAVPTCEQMHSRPLAVRTPCLQCPSCRCSLAAPTMGGQASLHRRPADQAACR